MSVFVLSPAQFGAIAETLRVTRDGFQRQIFPLSMEERWEYKALVEPTEKQSEEEYTLALIRPFVFRLYLANALAERYTYMKDHTKELSIPLFELPTGTVLPLRDLLTMLGRLSYNLVTNGGNTFLGVKDTEKLERVMNAVKDAILRVEEV